MQLLQINDPRQFMTRAGPFLEAREAEHGVIIGVVSRLIDEAKEGQAPDPGLLLWAVEDDDGKVVAAAMRTPPFRVVLSHGSPIGVAMLADGMARARIEPPGVVGPADTAAVFVNAWSKLSRQGIKPLLRLGIYEARIATPPPNVPGSLHEATSDEAELLIRWFDAFRSEITVLGHDPRVFIPQQIAARRMFIWKVEGQPVSMAAWTGPTPHSVRIGAVYTPKEFRNRGYASAAVAELTHRLLESGRTFVTLNADLANPTPNGIYQKIGFRLIGEIQEYDFASS